MPPAGLVSLRELADLAIGTPEVGAVNFNALHTLLVALLKNLNMQDTRVDYQPLSERRLSGIARVSLSTPRGSISTPQVAVSKERRRSSVTRVPSVVLESQVKGLGGQVQNLGGQVQNLGGQVQDLDRQLRTMDSQMQGVLSHIQYFTALVGGMDSETSEWLEEQEKAFGLAEGLGAEKTPLIIEPGASIIEPGASITEPGASIAERSAPMAERGALMTERGAPMAERGASMTERGAPMAERGASMTERGAPMAERGAPMAERGAPMTERGASMTERGAPMTERGASMTEQGAPITERGASIAERGAPITERGASITERGAPMTERGASIAERGAPMTERGASIAERGAPMTERGAPMTERGAPMTERGASIAERGAPMTERGAPMAERGAPMAERGAPMAERGASMAERGAPMTERGASMTEQGAPMTERGASMTERGAPMTERSASMTEQGAPMTERSASMTEQGAPITERGASMTEQGAPITERGASMTEQGAPITERGASMTEQGAPITEKGALVTEKGAPTTEKGTLPKTKLVPGMGKAKPETTKPLPGVAPPTPGMPMTVPGMAKQMPEKTRGLMKLWKEGPQVMEMLQQVMEDVKILKEEHARAQEFPEFNPMEFLHRVEEVEKRVKDWEEILEPLCRKMTTKPPGGEYTMVTWEELEQAITEGWKASQGLESMPAILKQKGEPPALPRDVSPSVASTGYPGADQALDSAGGFGPDQTLLGPGGSRHPSEGEQKLPSAPGFPDREPHHPRGRDEAGLAKPHHLPVPQFRTEADQHRPGERPSTAGLRRDERDSHPGPARQDLPTDQHHLTHPDAPGGMTPSPGQVMDARPDQLGPGPPGLDQLEFQPPSAYPDGLPFRRGPMPPGMEEQGLVLPGMGQQDVMPPWVPARDQQGLGLPSPAQPGMVPPGAQQYGVRFPGPDQRAMERPAMDGSGVGPIGTDEHGFPIFGMDQQGLVPPFRDQQGFVQPGLETPGFIQPGTPQYNVLQAGAAQPGLVSPGMDQPGLVPPGAAQPGLVPPGAGQPGLVPPGAGQPGLVPPGAAQPGLVPPGAGQPGLVQPGVDQRGLVQAGNYPPGFVQPGAYPYSLAQPGVYPHGLVQPGTYPHGFMQPGVAGHPGLVPPGAAQPGVGQPSLVPPGAGQPGLVQPGVDQRDLVQPGAYPPGFVQPGAYPPGFVQPGAYPPGFVQPGAYPPGFVQPDIDQQGLVEPGLDQHGLRQPGADHQGLVPSGAEPHGSPRPYQHGLAPPGRDQHGQVSPRLSRQGGMSPRMDQEGLVPTDTYQRGIDQGGARPEQQHWVPPDLDQRDRASSVLDPHGLMYPGPYSPRYSGVDPHVQAHLDPHQHSGYAQPPPTPNVPWAQSVDSLEPKKHDSLEKVAPSFPIAVETFRLMGELIGLYTELKENLKTLDVQKAGATDLEKIQYLLAMMVQKTIPPDLQEQLKSIKTLTKEVRQEKAKLDKLQRFLEGGGLPEVGKEVAAGPLSFQLGLLRVSVNDIEKELSDLRESQEQGKVSMEHSVSEASLYLQNQLDKLRTIIENMLASSSTLLTMSMTPRKAPITLIPGQIDPKATCPACSLDLSHQVSTLVQRYEQLQHVVTSLAASRPSKKAKLQRQDEELLGHVQSAILQVQGDCEKLNLITGNLIEDHRQKQKDIDVLYQGLEKLEKEKVNRGHLELEIEVKADKSALEAKVSRMQFDATTEQLNHMMQELVAKMSGQERDWQKMLDRLLTEMDSKLDRLELDPVKQLLEDRWKSLRQQLKERSPLYQADEAAGMRRQLLAHFHCLSCDRPLETAVTGQVLPTTPVGPSLPGHRSTRPYTVFELEQVRQQSRNLKLGNLAFSRADLASMERSVGRLRTMHSKMLMDIEKVQFHYGGSVKASSQMIHELLQAQCLGAPCCKRVSEMTDYSFATVSRHCGGSHTLTYPYRRTRLQHLPQGLLPEDSQVAGKHHEVDILGLDGHIYKGRMDMKLPGIPNKDSAGNNKHKTKPSRSHAHRPPALGDSPLPLRPQSANMMAGGTSATSRQHTDRPVSSQGRLSQPNVGHPPSPSGMAMHMDMPPGEGMEEPTRGPRTPSAH